MSNQNDRLETCARLGHDLYRITEKILECTQGDVLGYSRLHDLQGDQVKILRELEQLVEAEGGVASLKEETQEVLQKAQDLQGRIDHNLKIHAHLLGDELAQLKATKKQLFTISDTYKIKFNRPSENFDTRR